MVGTTLWSTENYFFERMSLMKLFGLLASLGERKIGRYNDRSTTGTGKFILRRGFDCVND